MRDNCAFPMNVRKRLKTAGTICWLSGLAIAFALIFLTANAQPVQAATLKGSFDGSAYGTYANAKAGNIAVQLGKSALVTCPCRGTNGQVNSNTVTSVQAGTNGSVLTAGVVLDTVYTNKTDTTATIQDTSTVNGLNLLNGLITATAIKSVATVNANTTSLSTSTSGSTLVDLVIDGAPIAANVSENTVISLAGIGTVTLKKTTRTGNTTDHRSITVQMLVITVSQVNVFNLPVGAQIVVASANSNFTRTQPVAVVSGQAYATYANSKIGSSLQHQIGQAALVTMGCLGTDGKTLSNNISSLNISSVLTIGTAVDTAFGGPQSDGSTVAKTTSTVNSVNLLNGLVTATTIKAVAQDTYANGTRTRSADGSGFVDLKILGIPVVVAPNSQYTLIGLGKVIINEQILPTGDGKTQVNGVHVFVTTSNALGLPVGSEIIIAHAASTASKF